MREFKTEINKDVLKIIKRQDELLENETINRSVKIADDILEIFTLNKIDMLEAIMILSALADSIYTYSLNDKNIEL